MNRGQVVLDVIARGTDEVSAMLRKVGDQAKVTEKQLDSMAASTADIGDQTSANKLVAGIEKVDGAVEGAARGIEKFNKVLGIAGFVGIAIAAVPAVVAFVKELFSVEDASEQAKNAIGNINKALIENRDLFREFAISRAQSQAEAESLRIVTEIEKVQDKGAEVARLRAEAEAALIPLKEEQLRLENAVLYANQEWGKGSGPANAAQQNLNRSIAEQQGLVQEINKARVAENEFVTQLNFLEAKRAGLIRESFAAMFQGLSLERQIRESLGLKVEPIKPVAPVVPVVPRVPPSGGGGRRTNELEELMRLGEEKTRQRLDDEEAMRRHEEAMAKAEKAAEEARIKASEARQKAEEEMSLMREIDAFGPLADDVANATSAMLSFGDAVGAAAGAFPGLSDVLSETMGIWSAYGDRVADIQKLVANGTKTSAEATVMAEGEKTDAIMAGTTAGLAAVGKMIGGLKAEYALRSLGELAWGFATLSKPEESAGHFVAAGLYAVAAGTAIAAGGGGARGGGAGGGAGAAGDTGGSMTPAPTEREPRTIVYNFSTLIADRQQVGRAIRDSELASERNGYGRRRGV
jgi:hypothetical protein